MATKAAYLEHYLESLDTLPGELQRNFTLLGELDTQALDKLKCADKLAKEYLENLDKMTFEIQAEGVTNVKKLYKKATDISDDKIQLAEQTYELVDKHIRRLDADLARFEADLKDSAFIPHAIEADTIHRKKGRKTGEKKKGRGATSDDEISKSSRKKIKQQAVVQPEITPLPISLSITHPSDVLDMPVDPNEPTYCFCHQVSYGEMIGCDNPDCPIEWFHFTCVDLTTKPKGKWYCSNCFTEKKKK